ncbi:hypothetical protein LINPERPRIM_LOCUS5462, partial [Linum perenne]
SSLSIPYLSTLLLPTLNFLIVLDLLFAGTTWDCLEMEDNVKIRRQRGARGRWRCWRRHRGLRRRRDLKISFNHGGGWAESKRLRRDWSK